MTKLSQKTQPSLICGALLRAALLCTQLTWDVAFEDVQTTFRDVTEFRVITLLLIPLFDENIRLGCMPPHCNRAPHLHHSSTICPETRP